MNPFEKMYQEKLVRPEEAVKVVKSGDWVDYSHSLCAPKLLDRALAARASELEDVNVRGFFVGHPMAIYEANDREGRTVFTFNSWFFTGQDRKRSGKDAFYAPMRFNDLPGLYRRKQDVEEFNVLMIQTGCMDKFGYFNLGPSISNTRALVERADYILVEENPRMPYVTGAFDDLLHISEVDYVVQSNEPLDHIPDIAPNEVDQKIAENILPYIHDRACLQLGVGGMPNAVGTLIAHSDLKDLSIHTELFNDAMMKMAKAGKITGKFNELHPGKSMFAFAQGSDELMEFMDRNPTLVAGPVDYVNSPYTCAKISNFISINNAINGNLFGEINAESDGIRHISGTGGQLDFVLGAYMSPGGMSFVVMSSTFQDRSGKTHSRIVPVFTEGTKVTDPASVVNYIATEYGVFNVKGKSAWQRAEGIIGIAHPDFRDGLIKEAEKLGLWKNSNKR